MNKYQGFNVLADRIPTEDAITEVANMLNNSGKNRSQRRRLERSLRQIDRITTHAQERLDKSAYEEYERRVDQNFIHFFAILGLTFLEDYNWKEDDTHGQIVSLFKRVDAKIRKYAELGYDTDGLVELLEEKTGIELVPNEH